MSDEMAGKKPELRGELGQEIVGLRTEMHTGFNDLRSEMQKQGEDIRHEMRVLHEDTIGRIAALAPDFGPVRREFAAADAELREEFDRRVTPLEADARRRR
jgi:hypothetical protein